MENCPPNSDKIATVENDGKEKSPMHIYTHTYRDTHKIEHEANKMHSHRDVIIKYAENELRKYDRNELQQQGARGEADEQCRQYCYIKCILQCVALLLHLQNVVIFSPKMEKPPKKWKRTIIKNAHGTGSFVRLFSLSLCRSFDVFL